jgi:hypothetical protein
MVFWGLYVAANQSSQLMWDTREKEFIVMEIILRHHNIGVYYSIYYVHTHVTDKGEREH